jgi:heme-degrading monooxygenase HmoA
MRDHPSGPGAGQTAVIFTSRLIGDDPAYDQAAAAMETLAAAQPGYLGIESARGSDGTGITISYWTDDAAAVAWRDHPDHALIRERGRGQWYESYRVTVARVERSYAWPRP